MCWSFHYRNPCDVRGWGGSVAKVYSNSFDNKGRADKCGLPWCLTFDLPCVLLVQNTHWKEYWKTIHTPWPLPNQPTLSLLHYLCWKYLLLQFTPSHNLICYYPCKILYWFTDKTFLFFSTPNFRNTSSSSVSNIPWFIALYNLVWFTVLSNIPWFTLSCNS